MEEYYRQHTQNLSARQFYRSFLTYLSVCGLLTALNIYTSPGHLWVAWIWGIWGIGYCAKVYSPWYRNRKPGTATRRTITNGTHRTIRPGHTAAAPSCAIS